MSFPPCEATRAWSPQQLRMFCGQSCIKMMRIKVVRIKMVRIKMVPMTLLGGGLEDIAKQVGAYFAGGISSHCWLCKASFSLYVFMLMRPARTSSFNSSCWLCCFCGASALLASLFKKASMFKLRVLIYCVLYWYILLSQRDFY